MTTHSGDGKAPECWVSVWISFFCFAESHNCESTEIHPEQTESRVRTDRWVHTDTHATCPVTFQTVPCQQQTTAVLHISHMEVLARSVIVTPFILFSKLAGKCDKDIFHISTCKTTSPLKLEHFLLCYSRFLFDVFNMVTVWYLCVYHPRCLLWFMSIFFFHTHSFEPPKR